MYVEKVKGCWLQIEWGEESQSRVAQSANPCMQEINKRQWLCSYAMPCR